MNQVSTPGKCQEGVDLCISPGPQHKCGFPPSDILVQLPGEIHGDDMCPPETKTYNKRSSTSPITEEEIFMHMQFCNMSQNSNRSAPPTEGRASFVSGMYSIGSCQNSPLRERSSCDIPSNSLPVDLEGCEMSKEHSGEMAERDEGSKSNGAKASDPQKNVKNSDTAVSQGEAERGVNGHGGLVGHHNSLMGSGGRWGAMGICMQVPNRIMIPRPVPGLPFLVNRQNIFLMGQFDLPVYADSDVFLGSRAEDKREQE
ncbi:hypothetical protein MOQ_009543 [Trypanosoma cruzi marinkellei]|uniref:Uncharacterized protein n=1 Tax=Trypanosoma cruzi marinkellei TaxID=85056 RepID=K2NCI3_TRYCR|nr:hypothetical protein MOQ_009543 [Trypanosoma cruzi marinkellei]